MKLGPLLIVVSLAPSLAAAQDVGQGKAAVENHCSACHATGPTGDSALAAAPPFRRLGERYPISDLEEALAEGIVTGHPGMPEFSFEPEEIADIVAYIQSLQSQ